MKKTELFFPFEPKPKGRPRFTRTGHAYTPKETHDYEKQIRDFYKENSSDYYDSAIKVSLIFYMPIPKSVSKKQKALMENGDIKHVKKPDLDNMCKSLTDSLNGVAYADDSLITELHVRKQYGITVGIEMKISEDVV